MTRMSSTATLAFVLASLAAPAAPGQAPTHAATLDLLLHEVRLLRQALERQGAVQAHVQLLAGRLALQDQRVGRLQARAERLQGAVEDARRDRDQVRARHEMLEKGLDSVSYEEREQLQAEQERMEALLEQTASRLGGLDVRRAQAQRELEEAEARFGELESSFDQLDRELNRTAR